MPASDRDPVLDALLPVVAESRGSALWVAEEQQSSPSLAEALKSRGATYLSNRWDQVDWMASQGVAATFNDFDLAEAGQDLAHVFLRVAKQRDLMHHLINQAVEVLAPDGRLWLAGLKGEGIKTHLKRARQRLGGEQIKYRAGGGVELAALTLGQPGDALPTNDYPSLRRLELAPGQHYWTKPGIYGWDKIDNGSRLLVELVQASFAELGGQSVLDLGCGYGYLACQAAVLGPRRLVATDSCAGALAATRRNLQDRAPDLDSQVVASDSGQGIDASFDLILCNPPFHLGFGTSPELHRRFLAATARLLKDNGHAIFVVNSFWSFAAAVQAAGLKVAAQHDTANAGFNLYVVKKDS